MVDWERDTPDPIEFLETLKLDLEQDEVYVFTPEGRDRHAADRVDAGRLRLRDPHRGRSPLHRGAGERSPRARSTPSCSRATPSRSSRRSSPRPGPSKDWLKIVVSPRARNKIRQWFSRERREDAIDNGRDELTKALRREGLPGAAASPARGRSSSWPRAFGYADLDALYAAIGEGHVSGRAAVATPAARHPRRADEQLPTTVLQPRRPTRARRPRGVRRGTRRRDGAALALLHAGARAIRSSASSPAGAASRCTAPTA